MPSRANFLTAVLKAVWGLIQAENKRTQLCLQRELAEEKSQSLHSQKLRRWAQHMYVTERKKNRYCECCKKVLYAGPKLARNILTSLKPEPARREKPGPTYNSGTRYRWKKQTKRSIKCNKKSTPHLPWSAGLWQSRTLCRSCCSRSVSAAKKTREQWICSPRTRPSDRGGHGSGVDSGRFLNFFGARIRVNFFRARIRVFVLGGSRSRRGLYVCDCLSKTLLDFGCIGGLRSLKKSRIFKF